MHLSAISKNVEKMIIGRAIAGIGIGVSSAVVPLYISEVPFFSSYATVNIVFP